jgi:hypothetical protein
MLSSFAGVTSMDIEKALMQAIESDWHVANKADTKLRWLEVMSLLTSFKWGMAMAPLSPELEENIQAVALLWWVAQERYRTANAS